MTGTRIPATRGVLAARIALVAVGVVGLVVGALVLLDSQRTHQASASPSSCCSRSSCTTRSCRPSSSSRAC